MKILRSILAALALCASPLAAPADETPTADEVELQLDVVRELLAAERRAIDRWTAAKLASVLTLNWTAESPASNHVLSPSPSQIAELRAAELEYLATRAARAAAQDRAQTMLDALTRAEVGR